MTVESKQVDLYQAQDGSIPYESWFDSLKDSATQNRIKARIARIRATGNLGRWKPVGEGVVEIALDFGSGYRIYAGQVGARIVLLLCGGDKTTQLRDIANAKRYWIDYLSALKGERMVNAKTVN